jgi:hypothetical protein
MIQHRHLTPMGILRDRSGVRQLALFVAAYLVYNLSRWIITGHETIAQENARRIVNLEESVGLAVEGTVQRAFDGAAVAWLLSHLYVAAQFVVLPAVLLATYRWAPAVYRPLRNTVITTWLLAIPIHLLFPVAPPRLAGIGMQDTVTSLVPGGLTGRTTMFFNPFAAVPSLHVGFAFALSIAVATVLPGRWKLLALLWGPLVTLSVVATGNHFVVDAVAGLAVTAAGFLIARALPRLPRLPRPVIRLHHPSGALS